MNAIELEKLKANAKERWEKNWGLMDFSWQGLGKEIDDRPRWPWYGHFIEPDGSVVRQGEQSDQAKMASVQDYWALDFEIGRIRSLEEMKSLGLIHGAFHFLNRRSGAAASNSVRKLINHELEIRASLSNENRFGYDNGKAYGYDGRVQVVGGVSDSLEILLKCSNLNIKHSYIKKFELDKSIKLNEEYCISHSIFESDTQINPTSIKDIWLYGNEYLSLFNLIIEETSSCVDLSSSIFWSDFDANGSNIKELNFSESKFYKTLWLERIRVEGDLLGYWSEFFGDVYLERAKINGASEFSYSKFRNIFSVTGSVFESEFKAVNAHFFGDFRADSDRQKGNEPVRTKFGGPIDFYGSQFDAAASFDDCEMPTEEYYRHGFKMAKFSSHVAWSKNALHAISMWANARVDGSVVLPHADTIIAQRTFARRALNEAKAAGMDALVALGDGAQTLKKALLDNGDFLRAQAFHKLELQAKMLLGSTSRSERAAAYAYGALSDWGLSWHRPLLWLGAGAILFAGIYSWFILVALGDQFGAVAFGFGLPVHSAIAAGIELSMSNALGPIKYLIGNDGPPALEAVEIPFSVRFGLGLLSILQQVGSLALLFLSALALRRRFQIG